MRVLTALAVAAAAALVPLAFSEPADALTQITVTNNNDSGAGSLRQAVIDANGTADDVEIIIPAGVGTITLTSGQVVYDGGDNGARTLKLSGQGNSIVQTAAGNRVLASTSTGELEVDTLTLSGGNDAGGGVSVEGGGPLTLSNSAVVGNSADNDSGGGIRSTGGAIDILNSIVSNNGTGAQGGGIHTSGSVFISGSTIRGNGAIQNGGGVNANGAVTVIDSTISRNSTLDHGGGIRGSAAVAVTNSTVSGNTALLRGGISSNAGPSSLVYSTVAGNAATAEGANVQTDGTLTSFASVIAQPEGGGDNCDINGATTSQGYNWDSDTSDTCGFGGGPGDVVGGDPQLLGLANNGGGTETVAPAVTSGLVDAIPQADCQDGGAAGISTDQRNVLRPVLPGCDIGAVELDLRPDNLINKGAGPFLGLEVFNSDGTNQSSQQSKGKGKTASYNMLVRSDAVFLSDGVVVTGTAGNNKFAVKYYDGPSDVTIDVIGDGYLIPNLAPQQSYPLSVRVKVKGKANPGNTLNTLVTSTTGTKSDTVKATTKRK